MPNSNSSVKRSTDGQLMQRWDRAGKKASSYGPRAEPRMRRVRYASELLLLSGCYAIRSEKKCSLDSSKALVSLPRQALRIKRFRHDCRERIRDERRKVHEAVA